MSNDPQFSLRTVRRTRRRARFEAVARDWHDAMRVQGLFNRKRGIHSPLCLNRKNDAQRLKYDLWQLVNLGKLRKAKNFRGQQGKFPGVTSARIAAAIEVT
jgi:hypothetical protein